MYATTVRLADINTLSVTGFVISITDMNSHKSNSCAG